MTSRLGAVGGALLALGMMVGGVGAQPSLWGTSGLLSIPAAEVEPYASFTIGANWVDERHREGASGGGTMTQYLTVGVAPGVELSLSATNIDGRLGLQEYELEDGGGYNIDRMASVQWRFLGDGREGISLALGAQDFLGMGDLGPSSSNHLYRANYLVASAGMGRMRVHGGLGTGRLRGAFGGVECPLGPRVALVAEHDSRFANAGLRIAIARRVRADVALMGLESVGGGLAYTRAM